MRRIKSSKSTWKVQTYSSSLTQTYVYTRAQTEKSTNRTTFIHCDLDYVPLKPKSQQLYGLGWLQRQSCDTCRFTSAITISAVHLQQAVGGRPPRYAPAPHLPRGRLSALRRRADGNVAAVSHGQHVPTPTAEAAWCANTAVSKVAWWSWPLTFWPWKRCPSRVWRGLPLCQFWSS